MDAGQSTDLPETSPSNPTPSDVERVDVSKTSVTSLYDGAGRDAIVE